MRAAILGLIAAFALTGGAVAQPSANYSNQAITTTDTSPLAKLPGKAMEWMEAEMVRQAEAPQSLADIDADIEANVGPDLEKFAKRKRLEKEDVVSAVRFMIVREAGRLLEQDIKLRKKQADGESVDLGLERAVLHRNRVQALQEQAERRLTAKASELISD